MRFDIFSGSEKVYDPSDPALVLLDPKLTLELGKAGALEFNVPACHLYYNEFKKMRSVLTVTLDDTEIFRCRVTSNERDFNNQRSVYCEGDLAFLLDSVQKGEKYSGGTHALFRKIVQTHNSRVKDAAKQFQVGTIGITDTQITLLGQSEDHGDTFGYSYKTVTPSTGANPYREGWFEKNGTRYSITRDETVTSGKTYYVLDYKQIEIDNTVDEWVTTYDYIKNTLIDAHGGYLITRNQNGSYYLDLIKDFNNSAPQEIEFGVNLLDLTETITSEELFTVLIPIGDENLTIESVNNGSDELVDEAMAALYGRIVQTHVFSNVNNAATLKEDGELYLAAHANVPISIEVNAVDLHYLDDSVTPISVGDRVHLNSAPHELLEYLICTKIEYDLVNPANTVYTFGTPKPTFTERYREDKRKETAASGPGGGYGAAGAAGGTSGKAAEEKLADFYNAWFDVDAPSGQISMNALFRDIANSKKVLEQQGVIGLDASTGMVTAGMFRTLFDEFEEATSQDVIGLKGEVYDEDGSSKIGLFAQHLVNNDGEWLDTRVASVTATTNDIGSDVSILAQGVFGKEDISAADLAGKTNLFSHVASIQATVNDQGSQIDLKASTTALETLDEKVALIQAWAGCDENGNPTSTILLQADVVDIVSEMTNVVKLNASGNIDTTAGVYASNFLIYQGGAAYPLGNHTHDFEAKTDGTIHIKSADWTGTDHSFNIADTQFYKDGVSAKTVTSIGAKAYSGSGTLTSVTASKSGKNLRITVNAYNASNVSQKTAYFKIDASGVYDDGVDSVTVSSVTRNGAQSAVWQDDNGNRWITVPIKATASNSKTGTGSTDVAVTAVYNSGVTDGRVGYTKGTFTAVEITPIGAGAWYYGDGGNVSGYNQGSRVTSQLYYYEDGSYHKWDMTNVPLYMGGSYYYYSLRNNSYYRYEAGTKGTYYTKS